MKKFLSITALILLVIVALSGCGGTKEKPAQPQAEAVKLNIAAAASLKDAAEEIKTIYSKQNQNINITYIFNASGPLQQQIEQGAPVDMFISAAKKQMDALDEKGLILKETRKDLLGNDLVLIAPKDTKITGFEDLIKPETDRVSIGTPESVPAGSYAKEALTKMQIWDKIQTKLVPAKDVRQVLHYVETGNVAAGMVYKSDALTSQEVKIVAYAPSDSHKPIVYPMAVLSNSKQQKETEKFADFLSGEEASKVFEKYGFKTIKK
ncbi:molybdenum ABC transporter, periplasmic molybdate-binding protein [Desulfofarcimen acetoxidans DSM 771]|uniref:Molybdenum ABC transporter, periplasmic molybdate-binding protein n=1 Tax=Desulfofarcimen acetoxidans (strain ATCC 49208 / DSM 771 / KCTC 5769 / VKM B-1644 / 5575) TaxID=485916 RepID=C8W6Q8_DESAS|nr:molybdate ABC transporter substrate-binding protein [Desulfofarcimen acetoxidans]ACV64167.1 molybdenum ABC transporter, periplasmic molybdate-binding protein [Desulfofarcimen acetoxidans DSM 771]